MTDSITESYPDIKKFEDETLH